MNAAGWYFGRLGRQNGRGLEGAAFYDGVGRRDTAGMEHGRSVSSLGRSLAPILPSSSSSSLHLPSSFSPSPIFPHSHPSSVTCRHLGQ